LFPSFPNFIWERHCLRNFVAAFAFALMGSAMKFGNEGKAISFLSLRFAARPGQQVVRATLLSVHPILDCCIVPTLLRARFRRRYIYFHYNLSYLKQARWTESTRLRFPERGVKMKLVTGMVNA